MLALIAACAKKDETTKTDTTTAKIKAFATTMINDHTAVNKKAVDLVTKLKVTPDESATSKSLTDGGAANRTTLGGLKGAAFDKAYIDNEVTYHRSLTKM